MPVAKHVRKLYRGAAWEAVRRRILTRAGGRYDAKGKYLGGAKCEQCTRPDRKRVWVWGTGTVIVEQGCKGGFRYLVDQLWSSVKGDGQRWRSSVMKGAATRLRLRGAEWKSARHVLTQIGVAHKNHVSGDDRDENLLALCRWCHLYHDRGQHRETRSTRKDAQRELLKAMAS